MNGNVKVNNLDQAYEECVQLYNVVSNQGKSLITSLKSNINSLKGNWIGSDATLHINHLIDIYDSLGVIVSETGKIVSAVSEGVINIQRVRRANGGSGNVGDSLPTTFESAEAIADVPDTVEYDCKPGAKNDQMLLSGICMEYDNFHTEFNSAKETLLANWQEGSNREGAVRLFNEFQEVSAANKTKLREALDNLTTAVNNISQLNQ